MKMVKLYGVRSIQNSDGSLVVLSSDFYSIVLIKFDSNGNLLWIQDIQQVYDDDKPMFINLIENNGLIVTGWNHKCCTFEADVLLVKSDSMGFVDGVTDISEKLDQNITEYFLGNYPNPFNPSTKIKYSIPGSVALNATTTNILLKVYDILGKEVETLVNKEQSAGSYEVEFQAKGLSSGVYFYTLRAGSFVETKKMLLFR